jgi:hypothetical protein
MKMTYNTEIALIEFVKLRPCENPGFLPGNQENYHPGKAEGGISLPVDYEVIGLLFEPIMIGRPVRLFRLFRNGVFVLGEFQSSPVTAITTDGITTRNSVYRVKYHARFSCQPNYRRN